jgi:hypothetical protein
VWEESVKKIWRECVKDGKEERENNKKLFEESIYYSRQNEKFYLLFTLKGKMILCVELFVKIVMKKALSNESKI